MDGGVSLFIIIFISFFIADQQRAGPSASSAPPKGGTDIIFPFYSLLSRPSQKLRGVAVLCHVPLERLVMHPHF
jgi:hypothetical protein